MTIGAVQTLPGFRRQFSPLRGKSSDLLRCARAQNIRDSALPVRKKPLKVQDGTAGRILPFARREGGLRSYEISNEPK
jgi:hypothetical protein